MKNAGHAHMGVGTATGKDKAELAAKAAISSPLLESSITGAHGILISITASPDVGLERQLLLPSKHTASQRPRGTSPVDQASSYRPRRTAWVQIMTDGREALFLLASPL